jgi:hypothetical protein
MGFESFDSYQFTFCIILVATFALFPGDFALAVAGVLVAVNTLFLNYLLMFRAWRLHRQSAKDFASIGLPVPAFKFTPIWKR